MVNEEEVTTQAVDRVKAQDWPQDRYLTVEGLRIRYWDEGHAPAVLLIHGFGASCEYWRWNFGALAENFRVLAPDLPGHGLSEKRIPEYSTAFAADFLAAFLDAVGVEKAMVAGKSLGGALALALAVYHPERVEKLVLVNSAGLGREISRGFRLLAIPGLRTLLTTPTRLGMKLVLKSFAFRKQVITEEWVDRAYKLARQPGMRQMVRGLARVGLDLGGQRREAWEPVLKRLGEIRAPTLIVWGAQDPTIPVSHAYTAQRLIPKARLHIFEGCGHLTQMEVPEEFNRLVIDFLHEGKED